MDYNTLYQKLEELTPLLFDCGRLCGSRCCRSEDDTDGMLLFPGEEKLFANAQGMRLHPTQLEGYGPATLLICPGTCDRTARPLACRVFPLAPALENGQIVCRPDSRGRFLCPLCRDDTEALDPAFVSAVQDIYSSLYAHGDTRPFIEYLCRAAQSGADPLGLGI